MLYGRSGEQAAVEELLTGAREGRSGVLVLRGEPGIGKSALLQYAAERAGSGFGVLRATGVESEADLPFAGLHLLLGPALPLLPGLPVPQRRALEAAFGLAEGTGAGDRLLGGLATLGLLAELAQQRPLLCLVDDAQWLDRSSTDALLLAARRLGSEGVVLLFAARDGEGSFAAPGLPELRLAPLEPSAAAKLLAARTDEAAGVGLRYRVLAEAQGNPLALTELPLALAAAPSPAPASWRSPAGSGRPSTVRWPGCPGRAGPCCWWPPPRRAASWPPCCGPPRCSGPGPRTCCPPNGPAC